MTVTGPSGTEYKVEPLATMLRVSPVQVIDTYLSVIVTNNEKREDIDALLDARNEYTDAPVSA